MTRSIRAEGRNYVRYSNLTQEQALAVNASEQERRWAAEEGSRKLLNALLRMHDRIRGEA